MIRVAAIAGAIMLALLAYQTHRANKATKQLARAEIAIETATAQVEAEKAARARDTRFADELSAIRSDMAANAREFNDRLSSTKVTREIRYVTQDGTEAVCVQRDPQPYRLQFNEAVAGSPPGP